MEPERSHSVLQSIRGRELGLGPPGFLRHVSGNSGFVSRLKLQRVLKGHSGCVNTVGWSENGEFLVSGSDDTALCIWDHHNEDALKYRFSTGHSANIFCARFVPGSANQRVVSCAGDHEVRLFDLSRTKPSTTSPSPRGVPSPATPVRIYDACDGRVKKLAFDSSAPESIFYVASEDGTVRKFDTREPFACSQRVRGQGTCDSGVCVDLRGRNDEETIELYSISISQNLLAVAGTDPHIRLYDLRMLRDPAEAYKTNPVKYLGVPRIVNQCKAQGSVFLSSRGHITGISFRGKDLVASYISDAIYLFNVDDNLDVKATKPIMSGLGPAGIREMQEKQKQQSSSSSSSSMKSKKKRPNDFDDEDDKKQKKKKKSHKKTAPKRRKTSSRSGDSNEEMQVDKNATPEDEDDAENDESDESDSGEMFGPADPRQFLPDEGMFYVRTFTGHVSVRTIKECSFFGPNNEYVVSGSDCGHIFIWDKFTGEIVTVVKGDNQIVNSVQGHPHDGFVLASSGIESSAKIWAPGDLQDKERINVKNLVEANQAVLNDAQRPTAGIPLSILRTLLRNLRSSANEEGAENEEDDEENRSLSELFGISADDDNDDDDDDDGSKNLEEEEEDNDDNDNDEDDDDESESSEAASRRRRRFQNACRQQ